MREFEKVKKVLDDEMKNLNNSRLLVLRSWNKFVNHEKLTKDELDYMKKLGLDLRNFDFN